MVKFGVPYGDENNIYIFFEDGSSTVVSGTDFHNYQAGTWTYENGYVSMMGVVISVRNGGKTLVLIDPETGEELWGVSLYVPPSIKYETTYLFYAPGEYREELIFYENGTIYNASQDLVADYPVEMTGTYEVENGIIKCSLSDTVILIPFSNGDKIFLYVAEDGYVFSYVFNIVS